MNYHLRKLINRICWIFNCLLFFFFKKRIWKEKPGVYRGEPIIKGKWLVCKVCNKEVGGLANGKCEKCFKEKPRVMK